MKKAVQKAWQILRYEGLLGAAEKCYEKLWIDPRRYGHGCEDCEGSTNDGRMGDDEAKDGMDVSTGIPALKQLHRHSILLLIHTFYPEGRGGTERFVLQLAQKLIEHGNSVSVLTFSFAPLSAFLKHECGIYYREYEIEGVPIIAIRYKRAPLGLFYKEIDDNLKLEQFSTWLFGKKQIQIVHAAYPQPFYSLFKVCKEQGIPYGCTLTDGCMFCHYTDEIDKQGARCTGSESGKKCVAVCPTYGAKDLKERYKKAYEILQKASFLVAPSAYMAKRYMDEFPGTLVQVMEHGIEPEIVSEAMQEERAEESRPYCFLYAGKLTAMKGVDYLIRAFCSLCKECTEADIWGAELILCGSGNPFYERRLKKRAKGYPVTFLGFLTKEELQKQYNKADCVVIPSLYPESYNFVLGEAAANGCDIIASNIGALGQRTIEYGGQVVMPGNTNALKETMCKSLGSKRQGRKWERIIPKTEKECRFYEGCYER